MIVLATSAPSIQRSMETSHLVARIAQFTQQICLKTLITRRRHVLGINKSKMCRKAWRSTWRQKRCRSISQFSTSSQSSLQMCWTWSRRTMVPTMPGESWTQGLQPVLEWVCPTWTCLSQLTFKLTSSEEEGGWASITTERSSLSSVSITNQKALFSPSTIKWMILRRTTRLRSWASDQRKVSSTSIMTAWTTCPMRSSHTPTKL